jgi:hypothetical protein
MCDPAEMSFAGEVNKLNYIRCKAESCQWIHCGRWKATRVEPEALRPFVDDGNQGRQHLSRSLERRQSRAAPRSWVQLALHAAQPRTTIKLPWGSKRKVLEGCMRSSVRSKLPTKEPTLNNIQVFCKSETIAKTSTRFPLRRRDSIVQDR